jgi:hypothetical protein
VYEIPSKSMLSTDKFGTVSAVNAVASGAK